MFDFAQLQSALRDHSTKLTKDIKTLNADVLSLSKLKKGQRADANRLINTLEYELKRFKEVVDTPEIIFATTGTTSSGKSTLVNLLCGAFIMPEAVGEMSAGVVEIKHGDEVKVEVLPTKGSSWFTGTRTGLSDEDLQALLSKVMHAYNDRREESEEPECPRIKVTYPTRLGNNLERFGFPQRINFSLTILDLPGLKSVGDTQNASVINEYCARAMSFVTYNAAETDAHKQEFLLKQVVDQVKRIGGSPARMLFVLNRFDVYEADSDPEASKERAFQYTQKKIREVLARELPEHAEVAQQITPQRLATKPALLLQTGAFKEIERHFGYLVDEDVLEELPRKVERWDDDDKAAFAQSVLKGCYVDEFEETLKKHIQQHLPEILFPPRLRRLQAQGFYPPLQEAAQHIEATLMRLEGSYDDAKTKIRKTKSALEGLYKEFRSRYHKAINAGYTIVEFPLNYQRYVLGESDRGAAYHISNEIPGIPTKVRGEFNSLLGAIGDFLIEGKELPEYYRDSLSHLQYKKLSNSLSALLESGYKGDFAINGFDGYTVREGDETLEKINEALSAFSEAVSYLLPSYIYKIMELENKRLNDISSQLIEEFFECFWKEVMSVNELGLPIKKGSIGDFYYDLQGGGGERLNFEAEVTISLEQNIQKVEEIDRYEIKERERRVFLFFKKTVREEVPIYKDVKYTTSNIPSFEQVLDVFYGQAQETLEAYEEEITKRVYDALFVSYECIVREQKKSFEEFESLLQLAYQKEGDKHKTSKKPWEELKERHKALHERVEAFTLEACRVTNSTSADTAKR